MKLFWQQAVEVSNIIINVNFFLFPLEIRYIETVPSFEQTADTPGLVISLILILTKYLMNSVHYFTKECKHHTCRRNKLYVC